MAESGGEGDGGITLEYTPTWVVAVVCAVIIFISLSVERGLHHLGKVLKKKNQKPLFNALLKVKEELMLVGFISLLLVVFQGPIQQTCVPPSLARHMLPCSLKDKGGAATITSFVSNRWELRRMLLGGEFSDHCSKKGMVPLISLEGLDQLHIFIFVLAVAHVTLSALTMLLGGAKIRKWKHWEDAIGRKGKGNVRRKDHFLYRFEFIQEHFKGFGKDSMILSWLSSFVKQFYGSISKSDYTTMRLGFIMTHCRGNPKLNFYKYMVRALSADFKKVVGIRWYLWIFVIVCLLLNVNGWQTFFWISFVPLILLLIVGTKLEHIISQLAQEVVEKHEAIEDDVIVRPSDYHFWFQRPKMVLYLIHFILFQNAFEIAFFFWTWTTFGFHSCMMGKVPFLVTRLVISVIVQFLCGYSTLPLYAIVTQMGSSFRKDIFEEHVQEALLGWAQKVKKKMAQKITDAETESEPEEL